MKTKLLSLKGNKATGPDGIAHRLIKMAGDTIAKLTTVHKKDYETERCSYRPVSILRVSSKTLESCVNDAIVGHVFNTNQLVTYNQSAYRKGFSTELLLAHLTETWREAVDSGLVVGVAFIDFKKAFDGVNHDT